MLYFIKGVVIMTIREFMGFAKDCKTKAELSSLAKSNGLNLTKEELNKLFQKITSNNDELADEIFDSIVGGTSYGITVQQIEEIVN